MVSIFIIVMNKRKIGFDLGLSLNFWGLILGFVLGIGPLPIQAQVVNTGFADSTGGIRLGSEPLVLGAQLDIYRNWGPTRSQQIPDLVSSSSLNQWAK